MYLVLRITRNCSVNNMCIIMLETIHLDLNPESVCYRPLLVEVGKMKTAVTKTAYTIQWDLLLSSCISYNTFLVKMHSYGASIFPMLLSHDMKNCKRNNI
jgi:hypothetical protein